ncbi:uncharacterized protein LOC119557178 [Drosophila subpulchrella]|uniref:uncharacterized protein LOC119557178 n=1 Tax=Drosophila subpulchrella TaxID=1486046 RepID=UPI0018A17AF3|nr:uncharacterized protein LOC119557178 [Drosophila subpulchrella]
MNRGKNLKRSKTVHDISVHSDDYRKSQKKMMNRGNNFEREKSMAMASGSEGSNSDYEASNAGRNAPKMMNRGNNPKRFNSVSFPRMSYDGERYNSAPEMSSKMKQVGRKFGRKKRGDMRTVAKPVEVRNSAMAFGDDDSTSENEELHGDRYSQEIMNRGNNSKRFKSEGVSPRDTVSELYNSFFASSGSFRNPQQMMNRGNNFERLDLEADSAMTTASEGSTTDDVESDTDGNEEMMNYFKNLERQESAMESGGTSSEFVATDTGRTLQKMPKDWKKWSLTQRKKAFYRLRNERDRKRNQTPDNPPKEPMRTVAEVVIEVPTSAVASGDEGSSGENNKTRRACGTIVVPNEILVAGHNYIKCTLTLKVEPNEE